MDTQVNIIGGGLAGSEAALQLAARGIPVTLVEMRPATETAVHKTGDYAELVCSNSLKSTKPESAAGMLKYELNALGSQVLAAAYRTSVPAGGALAVDRTAFSHVVTEAVKASPLICCREGEVLDIRDDGLLVLRAPDGSQDVVPAPRATIVATGPLTGDALASCIERLTGSEHLSFYDAAAPIVMTDSLDEDVLFRQSRYEDAGEGDYLNAPFTKQEYEDFITELLAADRVIAKDFETRELFRACQPIEEIARRGFDAPRHGTMKPVGLVDPRTGKRPWAAVQLRFEDAHGSSSNLVGFQTNLTFPEQRRVFRMIPGFENAEFARYGVMHRNTFIDAPSVLDRSLRLRSFAHPLFFAGQVSGTEGYCEAIMSGLYAALCVAALLAGTDCPEFPRETAFGSLLAYATDPQTRDYQPSHVNFGVFLPIQPHIKNKRDRYAAFMARGHKAMDDYAALLRRCNLMPLRE
jgi:methylenetetrahydrofolate--tRNA-(uracil-5-)-methyltransferase